MTEQLRQLHEIYRHDTGLEISYRYDRERAWYEFDKAGFTQDDLRLVLSYLKFQIKANNWHPSCLGFSNIIHRLDKFEEYLALARTYSRNNKPQTNRENIIKAFRPEVGTAPQTQSCKPAKEVVEKLIDELKRAAR